MKNETFTSIDIDPKVPWQIYANCVGEDPELFFPVSEKGKIAQRQIEVAKKVCSGCKVLDKCLEFALENRDEGIWGGLTDKERNGIRNRTVRSRRSYVA